MDKKSIIAKIKENQKLLKKYHVINIGLFGSFSRGKETANSDIDILVEFDESAFGENYDGYFDNITSLSADLEILLNRKIDLLTSDMISQYMAPAILNEVKYIEGI